MEGFWSLLRSWLRPHRGISQDKLPLYLGSFQFVHNAPTRQSPPWRPHHRTRQMIQANTPEPDMSHVSCVIIPELSDQNLSEPRMTFISAQVERVTGSD